MKEIFYLKLKVKNYLNNIRVKKINKRTSEQVKNASVFWMVFSTFLKIMILSFFGFLILFPFYFMITVALAPDSQVTSPGGLSKIVPDSINWGNFKRALEEGYWKAVFFTFIIAAISITAKILISMTLGYAFSLKTWRFKNALWLFLLSLLVLPEIALLVGQLRIVTTLGLKNSSVGLVITLVLPFAASVFSAFLFKVAFEAIPGRINEAALVDGCNGFTYFWKIAIPMITPTVWTVGILTAFSAWNSFIWPSIILPPNDPSLNGFFDNVIVINTWVFTTGKIIDSAGDTRGFLPNIRLAAATLAIAPLFIVYFLIRKRIMSAISHQGKSIKG